MRRVLITIGVLISIVVINLIAYRAVVNPPLVIEAPIPTGSLLLNWDEFMTIKEQADKTWRIPETIAAYEGKLVTIDGVLFTMPQFIQETKMEAAILTPPSRFGCCGLQCTTRPQLMMLAMWKNPLLVPTEKTVVARVTGILRFNRDGTAWTMSELENAQAYFP